MRLGLNCLQLPRQRSITATMSYAVAHKVFDLDELHIWLLLIDLHFSLDTVFSCRYNSASMSAWK